MPTWLVVRGGSFWGKFCPNPAEAGLALSPARTWPYGAGYGMHPGSVSLSEAHSSSLHRSAPTLPRWLHHCPSVALWKVPTHGAYRCGLRAVNRTEGGSRRTRPGLADAEQAQASTGTPASIQFPSGLLNADFSGLTHIHCLRPRLRIAPLGRCRFWTANRHAQHSRAAGHSPPSSCRAAPAHDLAGSASDWADNQGTDIPAIGLLSLLSAGLA